MPSGFTRQMVDQLPVNQVVAWKPETHNMDQRAFHALAQHLIELEDAGVIKITDKKPERQSGERLWNIVMFKRIK